MKTSNKLVLTGDPLYADLSEREKKGERGSKREIDRDWRQLEEVF
jgi:hypothetical protein